MAMNKWMKINDWILMSMIKIGRIDENDECMNYKVWKWGYGWKWMKEILMKAWMTMSENGELDENESIKYNEWVGMCEEMNKSMNDD